MGQLHYKEHLIVSGGRAPGTEADLPGYLPVAVVHWKAKNGTTALHLLKGKKLHPTIPEASDAALEQAKAWIDYRLTLKREL